MKKSASNPFAIEPSLLSAAQIGVSAPMVIAHRLSRMAQAGASGKPLSAADRREFTQMGTEKVLAFSQAWMAMGMQMWKLQVQLATAMMTPWASMSPSRRTPGGWSLPLQPVVPPVLMPAGLTRSLATVAEAGLTPIRRKAVANARRLNRGVVRRSLG